MMKVTGFTADFAENSPNSKNLVVIFLTEKLRISKCPAILSKDALKLFWIRIICSHSCSQTDEMHRCS